MHTTKRKMTHGSDVDWIRCMLDNTPPPPVQHPRATPAPPDAPGPHLPVENLMTMTIISVSVMLAQLL